MDSQQLPITHFDCAVCASLLFNPSTTICGHTFCLFCLRLSKEQQNKCPLCRKPMGDFDPQVNVLLVDILTNMFPKEYAERAAERKSEEAERASRQVIVKKIIVGNHHTLLNRAAGASGNVHRWEAFVRLEDGEEDDYIDKVRIKLHPTFSPDTVTLTHPPFTLTRIGWGWFHIRVTVFFKRRFKREPLDIVWPLSFSGNGDFAEHSVEFVLSNSNSNSGPTDRDQQTSTSTQPILVDDDSHSVDTTASVASNSASVASNSASTSTGLAETMRTRISENVNRLRGAMMRRLYGVDPESGEVLPSQAQPHTSNRTGNNGSAIADIDMSDDDRNLETEQLPLNNGDVIVVEEDNDQPELPVTQPRPPRTVAAAREQRRAAAAAAAAAASRPQSSASSTVGIVDSDSSEESSDEDEYVDEISPTVVRSGSAPRRRRRL